MKISDETRDFFERVYQIVRLIPEGRVTSYGSIAKALGTPKSSRVVGWAMNACHNLSDVPAHRVVNRNGMLTGKMHFKTPETMADRLVQEGVEVQRDKVVHFQRHFWDATDELLKDVE